jgi:hypothetical protein
MSLACTESPCEPLCTACEPGTYKGVLSNVVACELCPADMYIESLHECSPCPHECSQCPPVVRSVMIRSPCVDAALDPR